MVSKEDNNEKAFELTGIFFSQLLRRKYNVKK
ncbi:hypothetical protein V462_11295 [Pantoea ananatis 15320]|nr:hypothetical protein V462_11295 [Pantoea ananatis 15320]